MEMWTFNSKFYKRQHKKMKPDKNNMQKKTGDKKSPNFSP